MKVKFHLGTVKLFLIIFLSFHLILVWNFACISQKSFIWLFSSSATRQHILFCVILNCVLGKCFVPRTVPWKARFSETKKNYCVKEILSSMYLSKLQSFTRIVHRKKIFWVLWKGVCLIVVMFYLIRYFNTCHNNVLKLSRISTTNCRNIWCTACRPT